MSGTRRVYVPMTWELLTELDRTGEVEPAVEPVLAQDVGQVDDEEAEYAALQHAADLSAALLDGTGRRVVIVAEVASGTTVVSQQQVVAVHADDAEVDPEYLDHDRVPEPPELGWWATQEIPQLLGRA